MSPTQPTQPTHPTIAVAIEALPGHTREIDDDYLGSILERQKQSCEILAKILAQDFWSPTDKVLIEALSELVEEQVPAMLREIAAARRATQP